jgi:hypothetical protein
MRTVILDLLYMTNKINIFVQYNSGISCLLYTEESGILKIVDIVTYNDVTCLRH